MKVQVTTKFACDFCGKKEDAVEQLITASRDVAICNECVALCQVVLDEKRPRAETAAAVED